MNNLYIKIASVLFIASTLVTAHAIDNPDSPDLIAAFKSRASITEKAINNPNITNRGFLIAYDNHRIFLDKELNKAYKLLISKLSKDRRSELKKSQRNWIKFRDSEFEFIKNNWTKVYFGSSAGMSRGAYRNSIIENRVIQLLNYAKSY